MGFLKERVIPCDLPIAEDEILPVLQELRERTGITSANVDKTRNALIVGYDVRLVTMREIEELLLAHRVRIRRNWFQRALASFQRFADENERDAATAPAPPCCSHPDELLNRAREHKRSSPATH